MNNSALQTARVSALCVNIPACGMKRLGVTYVCVCVCVSRRETTRETPRKVIFRGPPYIMYECL